MHSSTEERFRILSIDGGGVRGYLAARILANIESYLARKKKDEQSIGLRFDFIAGTSTGGIISLALALGRRASEVAAFYEANIPAIFGARQRRGRLSRLFRPKYDPAALREALEEFFGDTTLHDVKADVCVVAVSLQNAKVRLYKSDYLDRNAARLDEKLVDIALATSAAPTYFPAHSSVHSHNLVDGGVGANNPSMIALVDALQFERPSKRGTPPPKLDELRNRITMVSIGTGEQCGMPYTLGLKRLSQGGVVNWGFNFYQAAIESQSQLAHFQAKFLLRDGDSYLRINPLLKFPMDLDNIEMVPELRNLSDLTGDVEDFLNRIF